MQVERINKDTAMVAAEGAGPSRKRGLRQRFYVLMMIGDATALVIGFLISGAIRFEELMHPQAVIMTLVTLPIFLAFDARGVSDVLLTEWRRGILPVIAALLCAMAVVLFVGFYLKTSTDLSRLMMMGGVVGTSTLLIAFRAAIGRMSREALGAEVVSRLFIVDAVEVRTPAVVHRLDGDIFGFSGDLSEPYVLDRLARCIDGFDCVTVACPVDRREAWALALRTSNTRAELLLPELEDIGALDHRDTTGGFTILVSPGPLRTRDVMAKRMLDISLAIVLLIFLAPLLLLTALAIKIESPGPVIFVQRRVGRFNRLFSVYKFRSMRSGACDGNGSISTARNDPRITRVGNFIRKTSIDELPQLINVLMGEMSFVGPRPHALGSRAGDELFWDVDARYWQRHQFKPGLTGLAQVRGYRGATPHRNDLINRLQADLEYVQGWNVLRDISILFSTLRVLVHKNAY